jgi:hypothetical protein
VEPANVASSGKNMTITKTIRVLALIITIQLPTPSFNAQSRPAGPGDVLTQARNIYYNLRRQGFNGFQATIEPNWEVILADTATEENLKVFRAVHFSMTVDARGAVTLRHEVDEKQRTKLKPYLTQIHDDVQRLLAGFFRTWSFFMIDSAFPETQIKIESVGKQHIVSYSFRSDNVVLNMSPDFVLTEGRFAGPTSRRVINPIFEMTSDGFLLTGYHIVFEPVAAGVRSTLDTRVEYQDISGMKLPNKIHIKGTYGSEPTEAELKFSQYVVTPRTN